MKKQDLLAGLFFKKDSCPDNQLKTEKILFYLLLIISFFTVVIIYFKSDSPYDTGDGIVHYQIARYSWKYPHLLLDLWGKPFFTLISSPFAQFGFKGMYIFQALNATVISWFLFDIASKVNLKYAWTIPAFVFFAPVYFAVMNSGLVEICFGMMFMFSVWLVFSKKYCASALIASLIPFVRPEAYVVMPLLTVIYVYRGKFIAIPLLLTAAIFYTLIGYFHYFELYDQIWGTVYTILLILGIGVILWQSYKLFRRKPEHEFVEEVFVLFLGSTIGSFILHTLLFGMPGILNNLGMLRYLAVLIPGSAFIALVGLNIINSSLFLKVRFLRPLLVVTVIILVVRSSFAQWYYPFEPYNQQYVIRQMAVYIKTDWPEFKKICFLHPLLPALADLDPYDSQKVQTLWSTDPETLNQLPDSTLLLWDSHFMKSDGRISFQWLSENPNFTLLKHYRFSNEELPFEACLFIRTDSATQIPVPVEIVSPEGMFSENLIQETITHTFENDPANFQQWIAKLKYFLGRSSLEFTPNMEFGPTFLIKIGDINKNSALKSVTLNYNLFLSDTIKNMVSVIEIKDKNKQISWEGLVIKQPLEANKWNAIELQHSFPELLNDETLNVNIYIWNKDKQNFYIDDFKVSFESVKIKHK